MSLFLCCVRAPLKLALLNWIPLHKYWLKKKNIWSPALKSTTILAKVLKRVWMRVTDNWQMAKILTDNWHLYPTIQTRNLGFEIFFPAMVKAGSK